ncbi:UNVERIFIED_CONTAM: hypothetical protein GTU68_042128, partial [Idotea baltica]|nr:hypothetical protein [Idotea baltica]
VLVTGGTGYIGSHTVVELVDQGYSVIIIDNLSNSQRDVLDRIQEITGQEIPFEQVDLRDRAELHQFFDRQDAFDCIIHFAALKAVGESVEQPLLYYQNNISGLCNLLECVEKHEIPAMVFSSSCTVYGTPEKLPVTESTPLGKTESPYGYSKKVAEQIIDDFANRYNFFKVISLRYFNPIGAHHTAKIGELPLGVPNNLLPFITQTAAGIRERLSVFGSDYNTVDGTAIRDYIHVVDLAKAHIKALEYIYQDGVQVSHERFNVGTGRGSSVLEVIRSFENSTGVKVNYTLVDRRLGDVEAIYADASSANEVLGWEAIYDLDTMTKSAWLWQLTLPKK